MPNKQMTPELYINLLADGFTHMDIFFPNDRKDKMFSEKDPKKLGRNLVQIALEKMEIEDQVKQRISDHQDVNSADYNLDTVAV
jgi:hypothetical protein